MAALNRSLNELEDTGKRLHQRWEQTKTSWNDPVSRTFESDYLTPIEAEMQTTLKEMQRLAQAIDAARRTVP